MRGDLEAVEGVAGAEQQAGDGREERGRRRSAITPTRANWEAPVNTSSESAQDCHTSSPLATEIAPKEIP